MPHGQPLQLANLGPRFQPGQSGNPGGRPAGVVYPVEYLRSMGGMSQVELEKIRDDISQPVNRRAAAIMVLQMVSGKPLPRWLIGPAERQYKQFKWRHGRTVMRPRCWLNCDSACQSVED